MRKFGIFCLVMCIVITLFAPVTAYATVDALPSDTALADPAVQSGCHSTDARNAFLGTGSLTENVQAAFLFETKSQTLMFAQNPDTQVSPSSLVKILTALIAIEKGELEQTVTVTQSALASVPYDAAVAELVAGEAISLLDLVYCMMVGSANDAAAMIAEHISGGQDAFVDLMNDYANKLGCTSTHFMNAHGLHHDEQYSTVRDIAKILCAALENETFRTIFSTVHYTVPATNKSEQRELSSGNYLMNTDSMEVYFDHRVTGGRTGIANDGRRCLAVCAQSGDMELISVITGSESVLHDDGYAVKVFGGYKETTALLDAGFNGYRAVQVLFPTQPLIQRSVLNATHDVVLGTQTAAYTVLPIEATTADLHFRYTNVVEELKAPIEQGEHLSTVQIWYGSLCLAQAELYAMNTVPEVYIENGHDADDDADQNSGVLTAVLITVLCIVLLVFVTRLLITAQKAYSRRQAKKYRRNRRRSR